MSSLLRTRVIPLVVVVGLLGACGESDSRQRNSALSNQAPTSIDIPLPVQLPESIALSGDSVVVASGLGGPITRINKEGTITVVAGVNDPVSGLVVNADGSFFVANQTLNQVRKIGLEGQILETFMFDDSPVALYRGIDDTLIVVLGHRGIVRLNLKSGAITEVGEISEMVREIAVDGQGNIYLYDPQPNQILKIAPDSTQTTIQLVLRLSSFTVSNDGTIHMVLTDMNNIARLAILRTDGTQVEYPLNEQVVSLTSLIVGRDGTVYITDSFAAAVHRVLPGGIVNWKWATTGQGPRLGVLTAGGDLYIANMTSNSVTKIMTMQNALDEPSTSSKELRPGLKPVFGALEQTRDGFIVPIMNFDPEFTYRVSTDRGTAIVSTGMVQVFGLSPDSIATLAVEVGRAGYADAAAQIAGRSLEAKNPAPDAPVDAGADETTSSIAEETTTSSIDDGTTTSPADSESESDTTSSVQPEEKPVIGEPAEVVQAQGDAGTERVLALPPSVIVDATRSTKSSDVTPVLVSPQATEIVCDTTCLTALLTSTDMFGASVTAIVPGKEPVAITLDRATPIAIGSEDTTIAFTMTKTDGKKVTVEVPVVHDQSVSYLTADAQSDSSNRTWWIALIVIAFVLLVSLGSLWRRRASNVGSAESSQRP